MSLKQERLHRASIALQAYSGGYVRPEDRITDLITDLLHMAVAEHLDPALMLSRAANNFDGEKGDK